MEVSVSPSMHPKTVLMGAERLVHPRRLGRLNQLLW